MAGFEIKSGDEKFICTNDPPVVIDENTFPCKHFVIKPSNKANNPNNAPDGLRNSAVVKECYNCLYGKCISKS